MFTARFLRYWEASSRQVQPAGRRPSRVRQALADAKEAESDQGCLNILAQQFNIVAISGIVMGYPIVVVPIFRSPETTDWTRLGIACGIHPIIQEIVMTLQRISPSTFKGEQADLIINDPKLHYHILRKLNAATMLETVFVMYRRAMLGCVSAGWLGVVLDCHLHLFTSSISHPGPNLLIPNDRQMRTASVQIAAIIVTALEEAILRATIVYRDSFVCWLLGKRALVNSRLRLQRRIWAASTAMTMYIEYVAIITCR